ncbi:hypothetical protein [Bacillus licheniformis]|uniref:hypothetical protein n=1 Tax=Bacillus licheniformis TaxID=1402 RepID=UPI003BF6D9E8
MNTQVIEAFLKSVNIGDKVSVGYTTDYGDKCKYIGKIVNISENTIQLKNDQELGFFESLSYPAIVDVYLPKAWFICNFTSGFSY